MNVIRSTGILLLILTGTLAYLDHSSAKCNHDTNEFDPLYINLDDSDSDDEGRVMQSTTTYPNMRFAVDYSTMQTNDTIYEEYVSQRLLPPIIDYFSSALKIKYPLTKNVILPNSSAYRTACGVSVPNIYFSTGVAGDMVIMVSATNDSSASYVASATSCLYDTTTNRPYFARVKFNLYKISLDTDLIAHETNMYTTMHELIHALGFSSSRFPYYLDARGVQRTNIVSYAQMNGKNVTIVNVEPVTERLRRNIGCSNITGVIMENEGGAGTVSSHFERRLFMNEVMTPSVMVDMRISELTLAMLEGSGWYVPDYNYSEPFYPGAGEGCAYYYGSCTNSAGQPNFDEYCGLKDSGRKCSTSGRGGAYCNTDAIADGCYMPYPVGALDCSGTRANQYAYTLGNVQVFGPDSSSKCFTGTLNTGKLASSSTNYCFTFKCQDNGLSTTLNVKIGNQTVVCDKKGQKTVSGYVGTLDCPDPIAYCQTVGKAYCPRGCMGRGSCINKKCVCKAGFEGTDCSKLA